MANDEQPTSDAFAALQARFQDQSRKAQSYYAVMHEVRGVLGSDEAASCWMEQPQTALGGKTPAQVLGSAGAEPVLTLVRSIKPGK